VKSKDRATFERLGELMASENNAERYRKRLAADRPPAIPFLGAFLPPHMAAATLGLTPSFSLSLSLWFGDVTTAPACERVQVCI
jgi:hypothetical protein